MGNGVLLVGKLCDRSEARAKQFFFVCLGDYFVFVVLVCLVQIFVIFVKTTGSQQGLHTLIERVALGRTVSA